MTNENCDPTRLEVIVDDGRANLIEVLEGVDQLHDNRAALFLRHQLILLQVKIQIIAFTVLQHCAEPAMINRTKYFSHYVSFRQTMSCMYGKGRTSLCQVRNSHKV